VTPEDKPVVVDTNILFSALLNGQSGFAEALLNSGRRFFVCEQVLVEIFRRKEKIIKFSRLSEDEVAKLYHVLLRRITLYKEDLISRENLANAYALCRDVDEANTPHVALTLELGGLLWTGDKKLRDGLRLKGFDRFFTPA
jgi:predicted nucleic acid-binding protein